LKRRIINRSQFLLLKRRSTTLFDNKVLIELKYRCSRN